MAQARFFSAGAAEVGRTGIVGDGAAALAGAAEVAGAPALLETMNIIVILPFFVKRN